MPFHCQTSKTRVRARLDIWTKRPARARAARATGICRLNKKMGRNVRQTRCLRTLPRAAPAKGSGIRAKSHARLVQPARLHFARAARALTGRSPNLTRCLRTLRALLLRSVFSHSVAARARRALIRVRRDARARAAGYSDRTPRSCSVPSGCAQSERNAVLLT